MPIFGQIRMKTANFTPDLGSSEDGHEGREREGKRVPHPSIVIIQVRELTWGPLDCAATNRDEIE